MSDLATRLKQARKQANKTQAQVAEAVGMKQPSYQALESGKNQKTAFLIEIANFLNVDVNWLQTGINDKPINPNNIPNYAEVHDWDSDTPIDDDEVAIVFYKDFLLECGNGIENTVYANETRRLRMSKSTLKRLGIEQKLALAATAQDNSMSPTIMDNDTIFIDSGRKNIKDGKIFAVEHGGLFRIKRLYRLPNGGVRIVSDNSDEYPEERLTAQQIQEQGFRVLGWVFSVQRLEFW